MLADDRQRAAAEIGHGAMGYSTDVRDYAATRAVMEQIHAAWGPMHIVVSGAAGNFLAPAAGLSANGFKTVVDIDLLGTFNVFRGCYDLIAKPGASLIAITAGQAVNPMMLQVHACAAKAGINQVIRVMAMEWGPEGVRVNGISPGPIAGTEGMARLAAAPAPFSTTRAPAPSTSACPTCTCPFRTGAPTTLPARVSPSTGACCRPC